MFEGRFHARNMAASSSSRGLKQMDQTELIVIVVASVTIFLLLVAFALMIVLMCK